MSWPVQPQSQEDANRMRQWHEDREQQERQQERNRRGGHYQGSRFAQSPAATPAPPGGTMFPPPIPPPRMTAKPTFGFPHSGYTTPQSSSTFAGDHNVSPNMFAGPSRGFATDPTASSNMSAGHSRGFAPAPNLPLNQFAGPSRGFAPASNAPSDLSSGPYKEGIMPASHKRKRREPGQTLNLFHEMNQNSNAPNESSNSLFQPDASQPVALQKVSRDSQAAQNWYQMALSKRELHKDNVSPTDDPAGGPSGNQGAESQYFELNFPEPKRQTMPKHSQMKAKTDGDTLYVRKTDLLITFNKVRPVKKDAKVHAEPTRKTKLDVIPVDMYRNVFHKDANGVFIPMQEDSALRICFEARLKHCRNPFMIRIYAGKVNVISGKEDFDKRVVPGSRDQDYIVVPGQKHIDGFAMSNEKALQFMAPDKGPGFTFDWPRDQWQDGQPIFSSLRFEITPFEFEKVGEFFIRANGWQDRKLMLPIKENEAMQIPMRIQKHFNIDGRLIRWEYKGRKYSDNQTPEQIGINADPKFHRHDKIDIYAKETDLRPANQTSFDGQHTPAFTRNEYDVDFRHFVKPLQNDPQERNTKVREHITRTPALQPGGQVEQFIAYDPYPNLWNPARTTVVNVHIVGEDSFKMIQERAPMPAPDRRPLDPRPVPGEEEEIDAYRDYNDTSDEGLDTPIEKFEIRDLAGQYAPAFTSMRGHINVRPSRRQ